MNSSGRHDLERFVDAQRPVFEQVLSELRFGLKQTHWMWFIFPQLQGLGSSPMARRYAIGDLEEARAYFDHPVLGQRLLECTQLVTAVRTRAIDAVLGYPDNLKFHSSMTLFAHATNHHEAFEAALRKYFRSEYDSLTMQGLGLP